MVTSSHDARVTPPSKYGINLMWLNKTRVDSQEYIFPATGCGRNSTVDECLSEVCDWKFANPQASVVLWYDSVHTTSQAIHNTQAKLKEIEAKKGIAETPVLLKDIREIPIVRDNPDAFSDYLPIYFRVDLMKFIICVHSIENEGNESAIFTDFLIGDVPMHDDKVRKFNKDELFSSAILKNLMLYGLKIGREDNGPIENQFFQVWGACSNVLNACKFIINICLNTAVTSLNFIQIPDPNNEFCAKGRLAPSLANFIFHSLLRPFLMLCVDGTETLQIDNHEYFNPKSHGYDVFGNTTLGDTREIVTFNEGKAQLTASNTTLSTSMALCASGTSKMLEYTFGRDIPTRKIGGAHDCNYDDLTQRRPVGNAPHYRCCFMPINHEQSINERLRKKMELNESMCNEYRKHVDAENRRRLLYFMSSDPDAVVASLQSKFSDQDDKVLMKSILTSPRNEQEANIAIRVRIIELEKLDRPNLIERWLATDTNDIVTQTAIAQLLKHRPQESIDIGERKEHGEQEEQTSEMELLLFSSDSSKKSETKNAQERDALRQLSIMLTNQRYDRVRFQALLKQVGVNTINPNGMTLLSMACKYNAPIEAIRILLKQGADPNIEEYNPRTKRCSTCFEYADKTGKQDIMQLFNKYKDKP